MRVEPSLEGGAHPVSEVYFLLAAEGNDISVAELGALLTAYTLPVDESAVHGHIVNAELGAAGAKLELSMLAADQNWHEEALERDVTPVRVPTH